MICKVLYYENFVGQYTIVKRAPPRDKLMTSSKHECLGEVRVVIDPTFARMHIIIGFDDCNVYLIASNFQLCINGNCLPLLDLFLCTLSQTNVEVGESTN